VAQGWVGSPRGDGRRCAVDDRRSAQRHSELLFPAIYGGYRSPSVLNKPIVDVTERIDMGKRFTQRGLRRAFNDLARRAEIESLAALAVAHTHVPRRHDGRRSGLLAVHT
jgi:hypothetical protein